MQVVWDIYLVTSPSGKKYVGQTKVGYLKRWKLHQHKSACKALYSAIAKYGADSFKVELIACCTTQENADLLERLLIKEHSSNRNGYGYNLTAGGRGHSLEFCSKGHDLSKVRRAGRSCWICSSERTKEWKTRQREDPLWLEKTRKQNKERQRQKREELKLDPEKWAKFSAEHNAWQRARAAELRDCPIAKAKRIAKQRRDYANLCADPDRLKANRKKAYENARRRAANG